MNLVPGDLISLKDKSKERIYFIVSVKHDRLYVIRTGSQFVKTICWVNNDVIKHWYMKVE